MDDIIFIGGNMKIKNYTKKANGQYKIRLDDDSYILLHEELILKYELLIKQEINDSFKEQLLEENKTYLIYDESIKYLSRKMRSINEMRSYLKKKEYSSDIIDNVIELLIKQGYLDDLVFSKAFVHDKLSLSNYGPFKIRKELQKNYILEEYINDSLTVYSKEIEEERVIKLISKAIKTNHNKGKSFLKQKILNDLVNLGYHKDIITNNLYLIDEMDDSDIKKKEYDKLYSKLSKKYSGSELEYKIKQKLYQKGFK